MTRPLVAVGFDGTDAASSALNWAITYAHRADAGLRIICVAQYPAMLATLPSAPTVPDSLLNDAQDLAAEAALRAGKIMDGAQIETQVVIGGAAEAMVTASKSAQLLVVGASGHAGLVASMLGSVTFASVVHAHCPVVVTRAGSDVGLHRQVVVGVDGSAAADRALEIAAEVAALHGVELRILSAWDVPAADTLAFAYWEAASPDSDWARLQRSVASEVANAATEHARCRNAGLRITTEVVQGSPGRVLADASKNAGLVVVGSRGLGGFAGLLLGSVSHGLVQSGRCPIMVVR